MDNTSLPVPPMPGVQPDADGTAGDQTAALQSAPANTSAPSLQPPQTTDEDVSNDVFPTTTITNLQIKDDGDLIEKEWVNKAKQIVERNSDDPYKQSEELTAFKAEYMKKRYNKSIKLNK